MKRGILFWAYPLHVRTASDSNSERPPVLRPADAGFIQRERLIERLTSSRAARVVVLEAPVGYSKSTCLSLWDEADNRAFCWVRCQARHDDPSALVAAIVEALAPVNLVDTGILLALSSPAPDLPLVLDRLGSAFDRIGTPFVLVVDDAHNLKADGTAEVLSSVAAGLPPGSQLAIASRERPLLPLGRLRANRELVELGPTDLAMTRRESGELLSGLLPAIDEDGVASIHARTEGWPAALYLAGLVLQGDGSTPAGSLPEFSGDDRIVVEYFRDEFFTGMPDERAEFLCFTSILEELSGDLCDAVLERTGSAAELSTLADSNAMVIRLDRTDRRFRYHHLFSDMLRSELHRKAPELESGLHLRASHWYEAEGDLERAVDHALAAGEAGRVGDLIWMAYPALGGHGRMATLDRWFEELGEARMRENVPAMMTVAHRELVSGRGADAFHWTSLADAQIKAGNVSGQGREADIAVLRASLSLDGIECMKSDAESAIEALAPASPWRSPCYLYSGAAHHLSGEPKTAVGILEEAARTGASASSVIQTIALAQIGLIAADEGRWDDSARFVSQARKLVEIGGLNPQPSIVLVFAMSALLRAREGRVEDARADIAWSRHLLTEMNQIPGWYEAEVRILLSRASLRLGDPASAQTFIEHAAEFVAAIPDAPVLEEWLADARQAIDGSREGLIAQRSNLTRSELRTLQFLPSHHSFRAIGEQLHLSQNTVKTQANSLYRKLGANSRAEAVMIARRSGLLDSDPPG